MNDTQLQFCDIYDKTVIIKSKSKYFNSETHKHRKEYGIDNNE